MNAETATTMTTASPSPRWAMIANVALFLAALAILGAALLALPKEGAIADDEQRALAPAPTLSLSGLVDGSYTDAVEAYIADHFPARDAFLAAHFWMAEHRGLRDEEVAFYDVAVGADDDLAPIDEWEALAGAGADAEALGEGEGEAIAAASVGAVTEASVDGDGDGEAGLLAEDEAAGPARRASGILVVGGRALQLFTGGPAGARGYARSINAYAKALRGQVRVVSMIAPTAQTFYLPKAYARFGKPEPPNIKATYGMIASDVVKVDLVAALAPHKGEYIFFRTDHHWTGLGAYYAYEALCRALGLRPVPLGGMKRRQKPGFRGSLARLTRDSNLELAADDVEYWLPPTPVKVVRYDRAMERHAIKGPLVRERGAGYGVFLGGDFPLIVATTEARTGRRALLVKNSLGNPLAVYLASHYDELVIVDYRYFNGSVLDLIRDHAIDDVIILNGTITANARFHSARVGWVLDGGKAARARRARAKAGIVLPEDADDGDGDGEG